MTTTKFLSIYELVVRCQQKEVWLYTLLKEHEDDLPELDLDNMEYWHKAFRQYPVTKYSWVDTAIWWGIKDATLFWEVVAGWWELDGGIVWYNPKK